MLYVAFWYQSVLLDAQKTNNFCTIKESDVKIYQKLYQPITVPLKVSLKKIRAGLERHLEIQVFHDSGDYFDWYDQ